MAATLLACGGGGGGTAPSARVFELTLVTPAAGSENVPLRSGIVLAFSSPIDRTSLNFDSVRVVSQSGREIRGNRSVGQQTPSIITFSPSEDFIAEEMHTIIVTQDLRSAEGSPLAAPVASTFTAERGPPDMPTQALIDDLGAELNGGRWFHRATLLPDGRILVAGGYQSSGSVQTSVELLDPFTATASIQPNSLLQARAAHIQVLLNDGTVLIAGGESFETPFTPLVSAERWDFRTGASTIAAPMTFARSFADATKLADGRVIVTGGQSLEAGSFTFRTDAEIYDPTTNSWTYVPGPATQGLSGHGTWELTDGRVLVLGGSSAVPSAELIDLTTGSFTPTPSFPPNAHLFGSPTRLADGRPAYFGGVDSKAVTLFDEQFGFLAASNSMLSERAFASATTLADGRVLIVGGTDFSQSPALLHTTMDVFAPEESTGRVFRVPLVRLPEPTSHHAAVLDTRGDVWLIGGLPTDLALGGLRQVTVIRMSQE